MGEDPTYCSELASVDILQLRLKSPKFEARMTQMRNKISGNPPQLN
jgi:hypothetical protein